MGNKIHHARNRNNQKVHQTIESYLEWWDKAYPEKKKAYGPRIRKTTKSQNYEFKIIKKEIILYFD